MSECAHDYLERELAGDPADGYCALCTKDRIAALEAALAEAKDEIIKLRADIIWIAKDRDDNRRWAEDRATVAVEMADQRDQARQALAERTRELELAKRLVSRLPMCSDHRDKFDPDHCQACRAIARASQGTE